MAKFCQVVDPHSTSCADMEHKFQYLPCVFVPSAFRQTRSFITRRLESLSFHQLLNKALSSELQNSGTWTPPFLMLQLPSLYESIEITQVWSSMNLLIDIFIQASEHNSHVCFLHLWRIWLLFHLDTLKKYIKFRFIFAMIFFSSNHN